MVRRSGGVELQAARGQMAVCGMIIVLTRVATSFAVVSGHGATARRESRPTFSPNTFTHHMCACRSLVFEQTVPQAEVSTTTRKAERNSSTNTSRKGAIESARWGRHMVRRAARVCRCLLAHTSTERVLLQRAQDRSRDVLGLWPACRRLRTSQAPAPHEPQRPCGRQRSWLGARTRGACYVPCVCGAQTV